MIEQDTIAAERPPRTLTVLGMLALTSLTFSYLGTYAMTNTLVAQHLIQPWTHGHDPRPRWLITWFCVLMLAFMGIGEFLRRWGRSDFKAIDEMANATDQQILEDSKDWASLGDETSDAA
ncbi:MAG TPA: hypothetical protein VH475_18920 [Tepidisphaeraceae bacterium]|jgi:hypothetical protein